MEWFGQAMRYKFISKFTQILLMQVANSSGCNPAFGIAVTGTRLIEIFLPIVHEDDVLCPYIGARHQIAS